MDEKNNLPEEQNNEEAKEQSNPTHKSKVMDEPASKTPTPKTPNSKLPLILVGVVAGVAAITAIASIVIWVAFFWTVGSVASCKHDDPTKIIVCEAEYPTCQDTGLTAGLKCTACGTMAYPQMVIPTIECTDLRILPYKAPTCQATGLSEGMQCNVCNDIVVEQMVLSKINCIESSWIIDKAATKTEDGLKHTQCTMCGKKMSEEIIYATGSVGLEYELNPDNKSYRITGLGNCSDTDIIIPTIYNGLPVTYIFNFAFIPCDKLTSIVIPESVTDIGDWAFDFGDKRGDRLISITVDTDNEYYKSIGGSLYTKDGKTLMRYAIGKPDTKFTIPNGVTSIGVNAFGGCDNLTSIVIPDGVTSIGLSAFCGCDNLTSIVIPDSVTVIDYSAFYNCSNLKDVYYTGTEEEWKAITIYSTSDLTNTTIHYNYVPEN